MIGVFDSGVGGLCALKALTTRLPGQRFIYLGDNAYAPYGHRSPEEITSLTRRGVRELFQRGCELVILACNTASTVALRRLQGELDSGDGPQTRRILGIFMPVVEAVAEGRWRIVEPPSPYFPDRPAERKARTVLWLATRRSVDSNAFVDACALRAPDITVLQQACPRLAEAIEANIEETTIGDAVMRYIDQARAKAGRRPIDMAVLGCTHYPLIADLFRKALPAETILVDPSDILAESLEDYLARHPHLATPPGGPPVGGVENVDFLTSGDPETVDQTAARFFGHSPGFRHVLDTGSGPVSGEKTAAAEVTAGTVAEETPDITETPDIPEKPDLSAPPV